MAERWDSESLQLLNPRKLLIPYFYKYVRKARKAELRYTTGTQRTGEIPLVFHPNFLDDFT
jgi:hypothetical protein